MSGGEGRGQAGVQAEMKSGGGIRYSDVGKGRGWSQVVRWIQGKVEVTKCVSEIGFVSSDS